eukprot:CAMPEP_0179246864 /NCGR_PEP_ID=MMETSP0797-20121207/19313_1 /TAXON_ID=47934 /ORGANISM="Dinophysis acuminata, Strain DAEP01" /LENGTH=404 /DNA_ID=CAMNT_0020954465 /DNA_START=1 /DNA_END=1212 /DNA_ORIENTATION=-
MRMAPRAPLCVLLALCGVPAAGTTPCNSDDSACDPAGDFNPDGGSLLQLRADPGTQDPKPMLGELPARRASGPAAASPRAACVDAVAANSTAIERREDVQQTIINASDILDCNMVAVGAKGPGYTIVRDAANTYNGTPSYRFHVDDDGANRVELSAAFVTQEDIDAANLTQAEIAEHVAAKSLYHFGGGFATPGQAWTYEYGVFLPSSLNSTSKGIISQWHGVPDRTTVMDPDGAITKYSLHDFNSQILTEMYFNKTTGYDINATTPNGYMVDQGGYPPLALKVGMYLVARADHRRITDKTDRVNISPPRQRRKRSKGRTKEVSSPYQVQLSALPSDTWIPLKFVIVWSRWKGDGSGIESDGSIKMYVNGTQVVDWSGPLGSNDEHGPYFKYGIYKPGATGIDV